jgi:hypothetical protein
VEAEDRIVITLDPTSAQWAREAIGEEIVRLRGMAAGARKRGEKMSLARPVCNYLAEAYDEAAIALERKIVGINPNKGT